MTITATALDLIKLSLKTAGALAVGQTPQAEDANDALLILNSMVASWNQNRWLVYHLVDVACASNGGQVYTVGPGGNFNVTRPDRIESAYARLLTSDLGEPVTSVGGIVNSSGPLDYPLTEVETFEEYGTISIKQLHSFPSVVFYDAAPVLGNLHVWPIPNQNFEIHLVLKETLQQFSGLNTAITLPPEYFEALYRNLTPRLQMLYQMEVGPAAIGLAKGSLDTIRRANHRVPDLAMPSGLGRASHGWRSHGVGGIVESTIEINETTLG